MATAEEYEKMSASEKKKEDWMNSKWRPMMGWIYMVTCITDFILFPVMWSALQAVMKVPVTPWQPITLQGAGLFHLSMGAIIGIAAFGRTQEKLAGAQNGGAQPAPGGFSPPGGFGAAAPSFGAPQQFGATQQSFGSPPRQPGNFSVPAAAMGGVAVGAVAGMAMAGSDPAQPAPMAFAPPQPSRPPLEDYHPELD